MDDDRREFLDLFREETREGLVRMGQLIEDLSTTACNTTTCAMPGSIIWNTTTRAARLC